MPHDAKDLGVSPVADVTGGVTRYKNGLHHTATHRE